MFEILAGAAGLVSLTIQIGDVIHRVRHFYAAVKNSPEHIRVLTLELELLGKVLAEYPPRNVNEPVRSLENEAVAQCKRALDILHAIGTDLEADRVAWRYSWGHVKAALQRKKTEELLTRIERLKTTLILAQLQLIT